jgi:hypothetical protein
MRKTVFTGLCILCLLVSKTGSSQVFSTKDYVLAMKKVTDVMVNDATSPVAASRYYAYVTLAANEVQWLFYPEAISFAGRLNQYQGVSVDKELLKGANPQLVTIYTIIRMGERLLPSGYMLKSQGDSVLKVAEKRKVAAKNIESSRMITDSVVQQIMRYSFTDGFRNLSSYPRYTPHTADGMWQPTAPIFMAALEPHWNKVRTFILDSAQQFKPACPASFDTAKTSLYYQQLAEVYNVGKNLTKEQQDIAMFWDCNPFAVQQIGHVEFALKKISPGGHWIGITGIACIKKKKTLQQTVFIHALMGLTLTDAFISCWDEKYRSNRVRPETAINKWIDPRWRPFLQTPPFPEYTSGHSVISTASAIVLTKIFGDSFSFVDNTETEFGLAARKFKSFNHAAEEAAISRFYGGIHYHDAIEKGQEQGRKVGQYIVEKLRL